MKLWKIVLYAAVIAAFASCSSYKLVTQSDIIYLKEGQDATSMFKSYDADILRLEFTTITPRFHYNRPYSYYWHTRPLWLDYNFIYDPWHFGHYSFFYRPWNYWDYFMRPWRWDRPWQDPMLQGPFNNQGYNVVYNNSRRMSKSIETAISLYRAKPRIKPGTVITPTVEPQNNYKPNYNNSKPSYNNNSRPSYNNNNSRPSYNNSRPSYNNSRPSYSSSTSKPSGNSMSRGGNSSSSKGINK